VGSEGHSEVADCLCCDADAGGSRHVGGLSSCLATMGWMIEDKVDSGWQTPFEIKVRAAQLIG